MKNLIIALVKFQKEVKAIPKNKKNPFFNSFYAELSTVIDVCSPALNEHGLAIVQTLKVQDGKNVLVTLLCHESGEILESHIYLPEIQDAQKLTASITYLRRSSYLAICGLVADEDDDGNSVSNVTNNTQSKPVSATNNTPASDAQKSLLKRLGVQFNNDISKNEASKLIEQSNKGK
jgi:hypothetical protein